MIETTNPEIDVNQLMERIRQEAAKIGRSTTAREETRPRLRRSLLPSVADVVVPPPVGLSRSADDKHQRTEETLQRARRTQEVPKWLPKFLRGMFRKQGGYNRALLDTVAHLAKTNHLLNKRVQELATAAHQQSHWLRTLAGHQQTQTNWIRGAAPMLAEIPALQQSVDAVREQVESASGSYAALREQLERDGEHLRNLQALVDQQTELVQAHRGELDRGGEHLRNLQGQADQQRERLQNVEQQLGGGGASPLAAHLRDLQAQTDRAGEHLRNLQDQVDRGVQDVRTVHQMLARLEEREVHESIFIKGQLSQQGALLQQWLKTANLIAPASAAEAGATTKEFDAHRLDAFYVSFENRFRGAREEIKNRVRFYLPLLREAGAGAADRPILDVGCGRGEWLELLHEEGLTAAGVDLNHEMVAQCQERNLTATAGDAVEFLRSLPENSHGAVSGFHIIEHLPLETLLDLMAETRRVLLPGGVAIFESPNCKNLMVGACYFNIDPTHRNPVFPETAEFMMATQGFENIQLEYLSPVDTTQLPESDTIPAALQKLLYGPQDFAVIARKPAA